MTGKFQISRHLYNFQFTSKRKVARHCSVVRFKKSAYLRIGCSLGRKPGGSKWVEEKLLWDTVCWLCGKGLDMLCDSHWSWLSWFSRTVISFLSKIGIAGCSLKVASYRLQTTVQYASSWIWLRAKSLPHEWNACGIAIPVQLRNIKKWLLQTHKEINGWK